MKKLNIFLSALALCCLALTSCDNDKEMPPVAYPDGGSMETIGNGEWDSPFSVWQVLTGVEMGDREGVWVTGYIVGYINTFDGDYAKLREKSAVFSADGAPNSNLLLAMTPDETNWERCIPVQLAYGTDGRDLSLGYNPEYLHRQVTVYGTTGDRYLSVYGVRNVNHYNWGPEGYYVAPPAKFAKVDKINDGDQCIMVAGGKYIANPVAENRTYGYLYVTEQSAGQTVSTDVANAFTFKSQGQYWTITDTFGRYVYMSGTSQSFDVSYELPSAGYLWDVQFQENGTVIIKNVDKGNWIQYSEQYTSYGCYPDSRGLLPALYVQMSEQE